MDPDAEAESFASPIFKTACITIVLTTIHSYPTGHVMIVKQAPIRLPDPPPVVAKIAAPKKAKKTLYLTFDDGPNKGTRKVMHIATEEAIPISMFLVGEHVYGTPEQMATFDSLVNCNYVEIDNHSFSHAHNRYEQFYTRPDSAVNDFARCADSLGLSSKIVRTPGRNIWRTRHISCTDIKKSTAAADSLATKGFTVVGWDVEWHFDNQANLVQTDDEMVREVDSLFSHNRTKTPDHMVLLAHDQVYADATDSTALRNFIKKLKACDEYNFEVISKYPGLKN